MKQVDYSGLIQAAQAVVNNWETGNLAHVVNVLQVELESVTKRNQLEPTKIVVTVEGGVVHAINGVPAGVVVEVHDYDVEGADEGLLDTDSDGGKYICSEWGAA